MKKRTRSKQDMRRPSIGRRQKLSSVSAPSDFRNRMETGPGGKQILLEDPDGNLTELFEPAR